MNLEIVVIGCGAMGSVYASMLADENRVRVVDRWTAHVDAINASGLTVDGPTGRRVARVEAMTEPVSDAPADLVIIASKALAVGEAARSARPFIGERTIVLTIQNGLGSAEIVAEAVGGDRLAVGIAGGFGAALVGPGHVRHASMQIVRIGPHAHALPGLGRIVAAWAAAGFNAELVDDIPRIQWEKLICNVAFSGPCVLTGGTVGEVMDDPDVAAISREASAEAFRTAMGCGVRLGTLDPIEHMTAFGNAVRSAKPSTLLDHERGRRSEIDFINGAVVREARRAGLAAPVNATITAFVRERERGFAS